MSRKSVSGKRGFVLLTVVLVAALLIVSSLMFMAQLGAETRITKTDAMFKSALSIAEAGLNTTVSEIASGSASDPDSSTWAELLNGGGRSGSPPESVSAMHGTYQVDVDVVDSTSVQTIDDPEYKEYEYTGNVTIGSTGAVYPPAAALGGSDYSARRKVETKVIAVWTRTVRLDPGQPYIKEEKGHGDIAADGYWTDIRSFGIDYGVFTKGDFEIGGNAREVNGDVYAGGNADIGNLKNIVNGKVYATGELKGKLPAGSKVVPRITFPEIDTAYYRALFTAYVNGTFPYDTGTRQIPGAPTGTFYTCTARDGVYGVQGAINRARYGVDILRDGDLTVEVTEGGMTYRVIPSDHAQAALAYMTNPTTAYFVEGDFQVNGQAALAGTLVVHGNFVLNGGAQITSGPNMPAILVTGNFKKNNGNAATYGLVYVKGDFGGSGTGDIYGALVSGGNVKMTGTMNVYYDASLGSIVTGAKWIETRKFEKGHGDITGQLEIPPHEESPEYRIVAVRTLDISGRSWVEVAPGT
jgi:hypothetical protein